MSNIGHINGADNLQPITARRAPVRPAGPATPSSPVETDRVEISDLGRYMSQIRALPEIRVDKVNAVRGALERGEYGTADKLDQTVEGLLQDLEALDEVGK